MEASPTESPELRRARFRYLRRTAIALLAGVALALILLLGVWKLLQSPFLCRRAAAQIETAARNFAGVELEIGSLRWTLLPPGLLLEDFSLQTPTLSLRCSRLRVGLGAFRISRRTLVLSSVEAETLDIGLKKTTKALSAGRSSPPIRLSVEQLSLHRISFEGKSAGADLNIRGGELAWIREEKATSGYLQLDSCRFRGAGLDEIHGAVRGNFIAEAGRLRIPKLSVEGPGITLEASGEASPEGLAGHIGGQVEIQELDRIIRTHGLLSGSQLKLQADLNTAAKEFIRVKLSSPEIIVAHQFPLKTLRGEAGVSGNSLWGRIDRANFLGGRFRGSYHLASFSGNFPHNVQAGCEAMDLGSLLEALRVPTGGLSAGMNVVADVKWQGRRFPRGSGRAEIHFSPRKGALPVEGRLSLGLDGGAFLEFDAENLQLGHSHIDLQGPLQIGSWEPAWSIHAEPASLDEILPAVNRWVGSRVFPASIGGRGLLDLSLDGPWNELRVGLHLDARDLSWPPIRIDRANLEAVVTRGAVDLRRGHFRIGDGGGRVEGALRWRPQVGEEQLQLQIDGRDLPMESVMSWAGLGPELWSGELSFSGGLRGSFDAPSGSWALSARQMAVGGLKCGSGAASVELEEGVFRARQLSFDGGLRGDLSWNVMGKHFRADLGWNQMKLGRDSLLRKAFGEAPVNWNTSIDWALDEALPEGEILLENEGSRFYGELSDKGLLLSGKLGKALSARLRIPDFDPHRAWTGAGEIQTKNLSALVTRLSGSADLGLAGEMALGLKLQGVGTGLRHLEANPQQTHISFHEEKISLQQGGTLSWTPEALILSDTRVATGEDELQMGGRLDAGGGLDGHLKGSLDARLLGFVLPEWEPAGSASGSVRILGHLGAPYFEGQTRLEKASFRLPQTSLVLSDVSGDLSFSRGQVALDGMTFRILRGRGHGGGTIQMTKGIPLFALSGSIQSLEYPLFEGLTPRISGNWHLGGPVGDFSLGGELTIDSADLRSRKDLPSLLLDWFGAEAPPKSSDGLKLDLHVKAERSLLSRSPMIRLVGSADLHILGRASAPGLVGQITFEDGGELTVQGVRYDVDHAHLGFADPNSMEAMVNIGLEARIQDYEVRVQLNGAAEHLVPVVSSEPPLSPREIFSLMSVGSLGSGVGAGGAIGLSVASSMLSTSLQNALESRDLWLLPIDQVRIDPFVENATGDPSARVTVVKQLSPSFTVTLQSDISAQKNQVITGRWYLGSGLFIEASRDQDRQIGIDFKMRKRY